MAVAPHASEPAGFSAKSAVPVTSRPALGYGSLGQTYYLLNKTLYPGAFNASQNVLGSDLAAIDPTHGEVFLAATEGPGISVLNLTTGNVSRGINSTDAAVALLPVPALDQLWVADYNSTNLSVYDAGNGQPLATVAVGLDPVAMAYDPGTNEVYAAVNGTSKLVAVDTSSFSVLGGYTVGAWPDAVAVDASAGIVYCANRGASDVSYLNASTGASLGVYPTGSEPSVLAYYPGDDSLYVGNDGSDNVSVLAGTTGEFQAAIAIGFGPTVLTEDTAVGFLYVVAPEEGALSVIDFQSNTVEGFVATYNTPTAILPDLATNRLYVQESLTDNLTVVDAGTNAILGSIRYGYDLTGVAYDVFTGAVAYTLGDAALLVLINATTGTLLKAFPTGADPIAVTYDADNECLYVANYDSGTLTVVNGTTLATVGTVRVGDGPASIAYVASYDYLYVGNLEGLTITIINGASNQVVGGIDLPSDLGFNFLTALAYDPGNGDLYAGVGTNVTVINALSKGFVANISMGFAVGSIAVDPYAANVYVGSTAYFTAPGNLTVIDANANVIQQNENVTYAGVNVTSGIGALDYDARNGVVYVCEDANATNLVAYNGSTGEYLGVVASNIGPSALADSGPRGGVFATDIFDATISFVSLPGLGDYLLNVTETGLPAGHGWSITLSGHAYPSSQSWVNAIFPDGPVTYALGAVSGFTGAPTTGTVTIAGGLTSLAVTYTALPPEFAVNFAETGLLSGTNWVVTLNGTRENSTTVDISYQLVNGSYPYQIASVAGYTANLTSGSVSVSGRPLTIELTFTASGTGTGTGGTGSSSLDLGAAGGYLAAGAAALIGAVVGALVGRPRRFPTPAGSDTPTETAPPPTG
jgi:YVTN family beta-propeller protein